jgi:hypothetical protein
MMTIVLGSSDRKGRDAKAADLLAKGFLALQALPAWRPPAAQILAQPRR